MKFKTECGKWIVEDKGVTKEFESSKAAWDFIFTTLKIRSPKPSRRKELYPVLSLIPPLKKGAAANA